LGDNLDPVIVRIIYEVDSHGFVFVADAPHFFMQSMSGGIIVGNKGKMEFVIPEVIGLLPVSKPGQLKLMRSLAIPEKNKDKASVRRFLPSYFVKLERFLVEIKAFFEIQYIEIVVRESEFHKRLSFHAEKGLFSKQTYFMCNGLFLIAF
jgi:hypothetical protein